MIILIALFALGWIIPWLADRRTKRALDRRRAALADEQAEFDATAERRTVELRAMNDRIEAALASNQRLIDLYAAITGDHSSPEAIEARAAAAERARWN